MESAHSQKNQPKQPMITKTTSILLALLGTGLSANAAIIITPTSAVGFAGAQEQIPDRMIDGSGLSAVVTTANAGSVTHAVHNNSGPFTTYLLKDAAINDTDITARTIALRFDLGSGDNSLGYDITGMYIWNFDQRTTTGDFSNRGIKNTNLGTQGIGGAIGGPYTDKGALVNFTQAETDLATATSSQFIDLSALSLTGVQFVQFDINSSYGGTSGNPSLPAVGLGEVRFVGTASVVPEPSSVALLGLGGLALMLRRRR